MDPEKILKDKKILVVDDEKDILDFLSELLETSDVEQASSYEEAKELLETRDYDAAVLDIMGVRGYELLEQARGRGIPVLMLTAHALSQDNLKKSFEKGAHYYVPKDEMGKVDIYLADILEALEQNKNVWARWYDRLSRFCDKRFGENWRNEDPEFWNSLLKY
ncbi:MAG: response regulator [Deltaproteobacteria bacterium]|nr:response regulator [Deltaproteobacteria bacterium]